MADPTDSFAETSAQAATAAQTLELPDTAAGDRFTVLCELARGGLGRVLAATDDLLGREVAIKHVLRPSAEAHARFEREVRLTARLQHAGVVPVYDVGRWPNGEPFFVMKKVEGRSLAEIIAESRSFEQRMALLPRVLAVADTVAYAHANGIIHRDLKPSNVVISDYGETVVVDWGLAKDLSLPDVSPDLYGSPDASEPSAAEPAEAVPFLTQMGRVLGTPQFMPPEQAQGAPVDQRADVYALGAILYNVLAGRQPYDTPPSAALEKVKSAPPPPVRVHAPRVPVDLAAIIEKAMARTAAARYATAGALAQDLRRYLDGQLVQAHRYPLRALILRWLRRHRSAVIVAAVLLAAMIAASVVGVRRIVVERNAAVEARNIADQTRAAVEARENALVLLQAQRSLAEEPTAALAWLKRFQSTPSQAWLGAAVAEDAVALGVARHLFRFEPPAQVIAVSSTAPVMAAGQSDGRVTLYDLDTGKARALERHPGAVTDLSFSRRGGTLASGDVLGNVRLWTADGRLGEQLNLGAEPISTVRHSPVDAVIAVVSGRRTVTLIDAPAGSAAAVRTRFPLGDRSSGLAYCPETGVLVMTTMAGRALVLDRGARRPRALAGVHRDARLLCLPQGTRFVSAGVDGLVKLWDVRAGAPRVLGRHDDWVTSIAASPDSAMVATTSGDDTVRLFPVAGGPSRILRGHRETVRDAVFSPAGDRLATISYESNVRVWDLVSGETLGEFRAPPQLGATRLAFTADARHLVASGPGEARLWPVAGLPTRVLGAHGKLITALAWSPDGRTVASASRDQTAHTWDIATGAGWRSAPFGDWALALSFVDARSLHVSTRHRGTYLVRLDSGRTTQLGNQDSVNEQTFEGPGQLAYPEGGPAGAMVIKRLSTGHTVRLEGITPQPVNDLSFTADGRTVVVGTEDGAVGVWSTDTGRNLTLHQLKEPIQDLTLSPDQRWAAIYTQHNRLLRWDLRSDQLLEIPTDKVRGDALFVTRDSRTLGYKAWDGTLRLVDLSSFATRVLRGHRTRIIALARNGARADLVATSDYHGFVRLWDLTTAKTAALHARAGAVDKLAFSPDGKFLVTSGEDARIRLWSVDAFPLNALEVKDTSWLEANTTAAVDDRQGLQSP
jgi:eukaryotic-like serine/threonine-protein kinase